MKPAPAREDSLGAPDIEIVPFVRNVTKHGRKEYTINADKALAYFKEKMYLLVGIRQAVFYQKSERIEIRADQGQWFEETRTIKLKGNVSCHITDLKDENITYQIRTDEAFYSQQTGEFKSEAPIHFDSPDITVDGIGLLGNAQKKELKILQDVRILIKKLPSDAGLDIQEKLVIKSQTLEYIGERQLIQLEGAPMALLGQSQLSGEIFKLFIHPNNRYLEIINDVKLDYYLEKEHKWIRAKASRLRVNPNSGLINLYGAPRIIYGEYELKALQLNILLDPETNKPIALDAKGDVKLNSPEYSGKTRALLYNFVERSAIFSGYPTLRQGSNIVSARQIIVTDGGDRILLIDQVKGLYFADEDQARKLLPDGSNLEALTSGEKPLTITANHGDIDLATGRATFRDQVKITKGDTELYAPVLEVSFFPKEQLYKDRVKWIAAWGGVHLAQKNMNVYGDKALYYQQEGKVVLSGNCRTWQRDNSLKCDHLAYFLDGDYLAADSNVTSQLNLKGSKQGRDTPFINGNQPINVTAANFEYSDITRSGKYSGRVIARQEGRLIKAETIEFILAEEGRELGALIASGKVSIRDKQGKADCEQMIYNHLEDKVIFYGNPAEVWDTTQGARGERITYFLDQRRFNVYGELRERAYSIYQPSGKQVDKEFSQ